MTPVDGGATIREYTWSIFISTMSGLLFIAITYALLDRIGLWALAISVPIYILLQLIAYAVHAHEMESKHSGGSE